MKNKKKNTNISFCEERLKKLKIKKSDITVKVFPIDYPPCEIELLTEDKDDNIIIHYIGPDGQPALFDKKGKLIEFTRKRLKHVNGKQKYSQPPKSGISTFITPGIIRKYKEQKQIDTLFITEGEFKAIAGDIKLGLDIIGISGIHNYIDKERNDLDEYIKDIIEKFKIKNIVLLFDADCLNVEYQKDRDLYKRPNLFYSAVKRFKEYTKLLNIDVYFSHIHPKYQEIAKGLDDLIILKGTDINLLKKELYKFNVGTGKYIQCLNISENSIGKLRAYFGIDSVENFYLKYQTTIQEEVFIYHGSKYQHDGKKLKILRHTDAELYLRVVCDYFRRCYIKTSKGDVIQVLKKWRKGEIIQDFIKKGVSDFFDQIEKYDGFCNIPDNTQTYKRKHIITDEKGREAYNYNLYEPLNIIPVEGSITTTINFIKHITNNENKTGEEKIGDKYTLLLDYLTLLYKNPTQIVPVLCLVSKEQRTGKTTFLNWMKEIYKANAVILGISEFKMDFNAHYATKYLIMIDETSIDLENRKDKERIKKISTQKSIMLQFKGSDLYEIDYTGNLIMCSNNEDNFIPLEKEDIRFFILKLPSVGKEDPDFLEKLTLEIPAFIYSLSNRNIFHPKETRAWFNYKHIITEQFEKIHEMTKPLLVQDIEEFVKDKFEEFPDINEFYINGKRLLREINEISKYRYSKRQITRYLKNEKDMMTQKKGRYPYLISLNDSSSFTNEDDIIGTPFLFKRSEWID